MSVEWIGVDEVAAEMRYTKRQAWEFLRSIGLLAANARKMDLARFTRVEFNEARHRALAPIPPRHRYTTPAAVAPGTPSNGLTREAIEAKRAKLRGA